MIIPKQIPAKNQHHHFIGFSTAGCCTTFSNLNVSLCLNVSRYMVL